MVGVTFGQGAGRVDSAPGRLLSLVLYPGIAICCRAERTGLPIGARDRNHSKVEKHRRTQAENYISGSYMHSPMEGHAYRSQYSILPLSRCNKPRGETHEPTNKAGNMRTSGNHNSFMMMTAQRIKVRRLPSKPSVPIASACLQTDFRSVTLQLGLVVSPLHYPTNVHLCVVDGQSAGINF